MLALIETSTQAADSKFSDTAYAITVLILFSVLFIYIIAGAAFEHFKLHYLHESGLAIMLGGFIGLGCSLYNALIGDQKIKPTSFNENFFFYFLLPPIIFSSGYNLRTSKFFTHMSHTLLLGILGTFLNFGVTVGLTVLANYLGGIWVIHLSHKIAPVHLNFEEILLFSSTICSSDTVTAMSLLKFKKYPKLYGVVVGEGLANDAVTIILYQTVIGIVMNTDQKLGWLTPLRIAGNFLKLAFFSIVIGIVVGVISALFLKKAEFMIKNPSAQFLMVFGFGYFSYIISEILNLSGILTILMSGIVMSHYTFYNLSQSAQISTGSTFNSLSLLAEGFIFMYLGLSAFFYTSDYWSITLIIIEIVVVLIASEVNQLIVVNLSYIFVEKRLCKLMSWKLSYREMLVVWFAGLVRGAIALALILHAPVNPMLRSTVIALVLITTVVLGALMPKFISGIMKHENHEFNSPKTYNEAPNHTIHLMEEHIYKYKNKEYGNKLHFYWRLIDDTLLKPWLIRDYDPETQGLKRRLKYSQFGPGRLKLEGGFLNSGDSIKRYRNSASPSYNHLAEPLFQKSQSEQEGIRTPSHIDRPKYKRRSRRSGGAHQSITRDLETVFCKTRTPTSDLPTRKYIDLEGPKEIIHQSVELINESPTIREKNEKQNIPLDHLELS